VTQLVWHATARNVAYQFQIEHLPPARRRGNSHAQDVPYVFGTLDGEGYEPVDHAMSALLQKYWTNFAKTGNPNGPGVPSWPAFDTRSRAYVAFTAEGPVARNGLRRPFCDLFLGSVRP
jgi:para-nitrobenzyl esterase